MSLFLLTLLWRIFLSLWTPISIGITGKYVEPPIILIAGLSSSSSHIRLTVNNTVLGENIHVSMSTLVLLVYLLCILLIVKASLLAQRSVLLQTLHTWSVVPFMVMVLECTSMVRTYPPVSTDRWMLSHISIYAGMIGACWYKAPSPASILTMAYLISTMVRMGMLLYPETYYNQEAVLVHVLWVIGCLVCL